jgi:hypothetical protein
MPPALRIAVLLALVPATTTSASVAVEPASATGSPFSLAAAFDSAAHQKYATVSQLYWYTDLAAAQAAAREQKKPILHLRMLGRLDEDLSCANSRFFRATLYANAKVSRLLRERFVLVWTSERPVPKITIDFGDGRKLEQTTTGNSAHYVMDADGHVLDVLPGLYAPAAFIRELTDSLALADTIRDASDATRASVVTAYHRRKIAGADTAWRVASEQRQSEQLAAVVQAQRVTVTKAIVEMPMLESITPDMPARAIPADRVKVWAAAARAIYGITAGHVLDEQSTALVLRLHDAVPDALRGRHADRDRMLARLDEHILADTALDQLKLRPQISREIIRRKGTADFAALNAWVYATVFHTPASDPWLGLLPRTDFTGLPGDGVEMP